MTKSKYVNVDRMLKRHGATIEAYEKAKPAERAALISNLKNIKKLEAAIDRLGRLAPVA